MIEVVTFPGRNLADIPAMLRRAAERIESGEFGEVSTAFVMIPVKDGWPRLLGFGDIDGSNDPLIQADLLRHWLIQNLVERT